VVDCINNSRGVRCHRPRPQCAHRIVAYPTLLLAWLLPIIIFFRSCKSDCSYLAKSLTVILPYFPTGTMERIDREGQIPTAMTTCTLLSAIPLCASGPVQILMYDIHALQERFYFGREVCHAGGRGRQDTGLMYTGRMYFCACVCVRGSVFQCICLLLRKGLGASGHRCAN